MKTLIPLLVSLTLLASAHAQLTMHVHAPDGTPDSAAITVAGTFNAWNPRAPGYVLKPAGKSEFEIVLPVSISGQIAFKFTLGSWERVETDESGNNVENRTLTVLSTPTAYYGTISGWRTAVSPAPRRATGSRSVALMDTAFLMPQLGRTRRIWLYLPPDYTSGWKRYPVLYMHDGQNLFDAATSFAGEWGIDETLDSLQTKGDPGCIVVGIENGGSARINEYTPWTNTPHGGGEGDAYLDFIVRTLKPYIDRHYRTKADRLHTAMAGSSLGGNISLYAGLKFPDVFGRIGVFSPALWFNPEINCFLATAGPPQPGSRLFFIMGTEEGESAADHLENLGALRRIIDTLAAAGFHAGASIDTVIRPGGRHTEWFWRSEFPRFYTRLFQPTAGSEPDQPDGTSGVPFDAYTSVGDSTLFVCSLGKGRIPDGSILVVFDAQNRQVGTLTTTGSEGRLDVSGWCPGTYSVRFMGMVRRWVK